ncbi:hypothetical protein JXO59_14510 [candidate division KSB1 bacterium]|nr:hypothetical protein [candidate division KSB1 bacterium]
MRCSTVQKQILDGKTDRAVAHHLRGCKACAEFHADYQQLFYIADQTTDWPTPNGLKERVLSSSLARLRSGHRTRTHQLFNGDVFWRSPRFALSLAVLYTGCISGLTLTSNTFWYIFAILFLTQNIFLCALSPIIFICRKSPGTIRSG